VTNAPHAYRDPYRGLARVTQAVLDAEERARWPALLNGSAFV
jgi:hypothetical protein